MNDTFPAQVKKHPLEYLTLTLILIAGAASFLFFAYNPALQRRLVYATSAAYFAWSLFHHHRRGDLTLSIIVEYLIFALFAIILLSSTLI